jgi:formylmethanofuran dehydrogenase subunit A
MGNAPTRHQPTTKTPPHTALEERKPTSVSNSFVMANTRQRFSADDIAATHEPFALVGGTIYDPATGRDGIVADLWIEAGRIVSPPADTSRFRQIDAAGLVVMPGGVDLHSHVAGPKVNAGRRIAPQLASDRRSIGEPAAVPTIHRTGSLYAALGYTTVFDAAIATGAAGIATLELAEMPILDKGFYLLAADDTELLAALDRGDPDTISRLVWDAVGQGGGWGVKVANPGGPAFWKRSRGDHHDLDTPLPGYGLTGRSLLERLARSVSAVGLPHPLHIHTANLGLPGNWRTLAETMRTLDGIPAHLAHVQFHSYTGGDLDADSFGSGVAELAGWFNDHEGLTLDVGQVLFGDTVAMTGDSAAAEHLAHTTGVPWHSHDLWLEGGCGVLPIAYKEKSLIHAWQWAIGLEWFLSVTDPWRLVLSTDHPNGAHFTAYPVLMQLLGDAAFRRAAFERIHPAVRKRSPLAHLDREYSLQELCIITRAAPARIAGLPQKGQLGVGADADITLYRPSHDLAAMFAMPAAVYKGGQLVAENGHPRATPAGRQLRAIAAHDEFSSELNG